MTDIKKVLVIGNQYGVCQLFREYKTKFRVLLDDKEEEPDLLVFTGGADIDPKFYGEEPLQSTHTSKQRDDEDLEYWSLYPATPKIGICRGAQFLNVMSGGSLFQHVTNHGRPHMIHNLLIIPGIEERSFYGSSMHHQMMIPSSEGEVLAIAKSPQYGVKKGLSEKYLSFSGKEPPRYDPEVVWYAKNKCLCYQGHPEYPVKPDERDYFLKLVKHFFG